MPPHRRSSNNPQPKGRTPKIAGRQAPRNEPVAPAEVERPEVTPPLTDAPPAPAQPERPAETPDPAGSPVVAEEPASEIDKADDGAAAGTSTPDVTAPEVDPSEAPRVRPVYRSSSLRPRAQMSESVDVDASGDADGAAAWRRVIVIGAVAVALAVFAVVAWLRPGAEISNEAWVDDAETMQVTAAARDAIQTLYTYGFETVDADFDAARGVLTDDMRSQFDQTAQVTKDAVIQTKTKTNAEVTDIGVKLLSDDHAELVATMNVSATNDGAAQGSASGPLSVTMTRVGGEWLLADIRDR